MAQKLLLITLSAAVIYSGPVSALTATCNNPYGDDKLVFDVTLTPEVFCNRIILGTRLYPSVYID